jgi:hypothetical protein
MKNALPVALIGAALFLALCAPAFGQAGPPASASLEDITGCVLERDVVFIVTGRDAATRRYKYAWDASIDALCNGKGFAIGAPVKVAAAQPTVPAAAPTPVAAAAVTSASAAPSEFPADAQPLSADGVARKVSGKTFDVQLQNGSKWRLEYESNGYLFFNASGGFATSGPWRAEDGRICSHMRGAAASCNEVREQGQRLYLKRDNGDVIALNPQ